MTFKKFVATALIASGMLVSLSSCGTNENSNTENTPQVETSEVEVTEETTAIAPGMTPFDFPTVGITAEAGDYVLTPTNRMWTNAITSENPANETYIYYSAQMSAPGEVESDIDSTFDGIVTMPNAMIIPIPKGQTAQKGDIVLTWWQTGSGMQRAIVVDDANPQEPVVMYLDLAYDNPATDQDSGKSIGATEYPLAPDSFVKITDPWQEGNMIAANDGERWNSVQIVKVAGEKVLTLGFAGRMKVYDKADCKPVPLVPDVEAGDTVQAVFGASFGEYTVARVDREIGRVFVEQSGSEKAIPYGQVTPSL